MRNTSTSPHPAIACFDKETRTKAYEFMSALPRWHRDESQDYYFLEEGGEQLSVCPMGACLFALGGNTKHLFPMGYSKVIEALVEIGRVGLASRMSSSAFTDLIFLMPIADNDLAAIFGVAE